MPLPRGGEDDILNWLVDQFKKSVSMPRPSNRDLRRQQIVAAFQSLIAEHGFDKTTTALIAEKSGLTQGLIHYHFKSKEDILLSLIDHLSDLFEARLQRFHQSQDLPEPTLEAYLRAYLEKDAWADPQAVSAWTMIAAEAARKSTVRVYFERALISQQDRLTQVIHQAWGGDASLAKRMAAGLLATIHGLFLLSMAAPRVIEPGFASNWVVQIANGLARENAHG